jgi:hypothetical protein
MIRSRTFAATVAFGFVALRTGGAQGAAAIPTGLYDELVKTYDTAEIVTSCASQNHESKVAAARRAFAVSLVRLNSGVTIYRVDGADPCVGANQNGPLLAFIESPRGAFREVLSTDATSPKMATFRPDGSLTVESRDSAVSHDVTTYRFDGSQYSQTRVEAFDEETGEHKQIDVPIHFAYGTSSANVRGKVAFSFPDTYVIDASAGQTMSIVVHPTSGHIAPIYVGGQAGSEVTGNPPSLSWHGKLSRTGSYSILVEGGGANTTYATYTMTVTIR